MARNHSTAGNPGSSHAAKFWNICSTVGVITMGAVAYDYLEVSSMAQGSLNPPPGAPAPSMKTLDQVEARIPVDASHTPGNATNAFTINQPGSYYLTGNIVVGANNAITITTNGVTL